MTVEETEVDGIRTLFAQRSDGHVSGGIVFRVGWADENLAVRGLTHLVAHLALAGHTPDVHLHSDTHATYTHFRTQGTTGSVAGMLSGVCAALATLPLDLLEEEKEVLLAEAEGRGGPVRLDALYRYGAGNHGLCAYPETGLPAIGPDLAQIWAAETFTRGNAVLWLSGEALPDDLRLPLHDGPHQPLPPVPASRTRTPSWYRSPDPDLLTATGVVPRAPASAVFAEVLGRVLRAELCEGERLSYSAGTTYTVRDAHSAVVTVTADSLPGERDGVAGGFVDALARLRWGPLPAAGVAAVAEEAAADAGRHAADHETVAARAVSRCLGIPYPEPDELAAAYTTVTPADVRACAEAFHASALAGVSEHGLGWAGWSAAPVDSPERVTGREHPGRDGHDGTLVVGDDGVGVVVGGRRSTVRYADLALMTSYGDGGRHLVGADGFQVDVEPTLYDIDAGVLERIDAAVDLARVVRRPARFAEDVPRPRPPAPPAATPGMQAAPAPDPAPPSRRPGWRERIPLVGRRSS